MKIKKTISLILLALGIAFSGLISGIMFLGGESGAGITFLIPTIIFVVCFVVVLFDKGHLSLEENE